MELFVFQMGLLTKEGLFSETVLFKILIINAFQAVCLSLLREQTVLSYSIIGGKENDIFERGYIMFFLLVSGITAVGKYDIIKSFSRFLQEYGTLYLYILLFWFF